MPKMKSKSGAKKRFTLTATGKVRAKGANTAHRLISKPKSAKMRNRGTKRRPCPCPSTNRPTRRRSPRRRGQRARPPSRRIFWARTARSAAFAADRPC